MKFPRITFRGIGHLKAAMGIPMGDMQTFQWMVAYSRFHGQSHPDRGFSAARALRPGAMAAIHHDVLQLSNGHWILLVNENKDFQATTVLGDAIVDLDTNNQGFGCGVRSTILT
jgi:hypothetical protein